MLEMTDVSASGKQSLAKTLFVLSLSQAEDSKEQVAICLQRHALDRITASDWSDLHHSPTANSHNAELQDVTFPAAYFTAPGTCR